ncbi:MAG TPA: hypothetical protein PLE60_13415 [Candidatus Latescibacteria bacterium]|nr:hypothetical protein [Candidatus Latescibacterota bacterium]
MDINALIHKAWYDKVSAFPFADVAAALEKLPTKEHGFADALERELGRDAEIETLRAELAEAKAEIERLRCDCLCKDCQRRVSKSIEGACQMRKNWTRVASDQWETRYRGFVLCVQKRPDGYTVIADVYDSEYLRSSGNSRLDDAMEWAESMVDAHWTYCERMQYQRKPKKRMNHATP